MNRGKSVVSIVIVIQIPLYYISNPRSFYFNTLEIYNEIIVEFQIELQKSERVK